jgi:hypothetical protein
MKRFALCLAVAFFVNLVLPALRPLPRGGRGVPDAFFALAFQMAVVLLLAVALYAATLVVEYLRTRRRPPSGEVKP